MTRPRKVDGTHREVVQVFRRCGLIVRDVSQVPNLGCDLIVLTRWASATGRGQFRLVEVKNGRLARSDQQLTNSEAKLAAEAGRWFVVVRSVDDALDLAREMLRPG